MSAATRPQAPRWVRWLTAGGRPVVLLVALAMCAPGEYHLAEAAGWQDPWSYGMPLVLSAYAGIAAAVASTRYPGDRGRWSAIIGAGLALALAIAAQIVSHLITTGHVDEQQPWLIAVTSLVPPAVVGHLLHLAASPPSAGRSTMVEPAPTALPQGGQSQDADETGETPPEDEPHAEDTVPEQPRLLTSADVAEMFRVDKSTVRGWVASGRLTVHDKDTRGHNLFHPDALPKEAVR